MPLVETKKRYQEAILDGMARTLWIMAYADWASDEDRDDEVDPQRAGQGEDWDDVAPETPDAAYLAARDLAKLYRGTEGMSLPDLFELAMTIDEGEFRFDEEDVRGASEDKRKERERKLELAEGFGSGLAHMALGSGVSWFDD